MSSSLDNLELCRLCLVKDRVSVPIFEDEGDVRQIFLKITACLPVKVSREDKLPKKICDDCVYKVELFYQFWNTTANAEKQLLQWLDEVGGLEDKQGYITNVLDSNVMKQERNSDNRLDGNVMQVSGHQNNMDIGMIENMTIMTMPAGDDQQFTAVPMDASGTVQTVQAVPGPSNQTPHDQMAQSQSHLVEEEEEDMEDDNSDDGCDNEEGLPVKEETEDQSDQPLEPTAFVNVPLPCDEAGPSGLQQQKISEISEMSMQQTAADGDPKTGYQTRTLRRARSRKTIATMSTGSSPIAHNRSTQRAKRTGAKRASPAKPHPASKKVKVDGSTQTAIKTEIEEPQPQLVVELYPCDKCSKECQSLQALEEHAKTHEIRCDLCNLAFRTRRQLRKHVSDTHKSAPKYICSECESVFKCRQSLREHFVRKHTEGFRFVCAACGKKFKMKSDLYMHVQSIHSDEREAVCDVCGKTYRNAFALKKHLAHAHNQRQFACEICKRKLATKESLEQHSLLHLRKERAVCQVCGKTFSGNDALKKHMRIHTGARPFPCKICGKTFRRQNTQKQHLLTHTGKRPYVCDICGKAFTQKPGLITHRKKHPGPLPPLPPISIDYVIADLMQKSESVTLAKPDQQ